MGLEKEAENIDNLIKNAGKNIKFAITVNIIIVAVRISAKNVDILSFQNAKKIKKMTQRVKRKQKKMRATTKSDQDMTFGLVLMHQVLL